MLLYIVLDGAQKAYATRDPMLAYKKAASVYGDYKDTKPESFVATIYCENEWTVYRLLLRLGCEGIEGG